MHLPEIRFKYLWFYDEIFQENYTFRQKQLPPEDLATSANYPTPVEIKEYIEIVTPLWQQEAQKILKELSKVTKLSWKGENITCYVVGRARSFSDPLTVRIFPEDPTRFIDVLTHELIHKLLSQGDNFERSKEAWAYIRNTYPKELKLTWNHLPVHAVHTHIYNTFYGKERLERDIARSKKIGAVAYIRSWEIVEEAGYKNIIAEFTSRIV